jgi:hypothetical protein
LEDGFDELDDVVGLTFVVKTADMCQWPIPVFGPSEDESRLIYYILATEKGREVREVYSPKMAKTLGKLGQWVTCPVASENPV